MAVIGCAQESSGTIRPRPQQDCGSHEQIYMICDL
jgi:hypothetical protein